MKQKTTRSSKQVRDKKLLQELRDERALLNQHSGDKEARRFRRLLGKIRLEKPKFWWQDRNLLQKLGIILAVIVILFVGSAYGIARWYIATQAHKEFKFGATFIPRYARYFELEPETTMQAMIDNLGIRHFRLVSYWDEFEKSPGNYDFRELDWQFEKVKQAGGTVSLTLGLRQPRWPECHMPNWHKDKPMDQWYPSLKKYIGVVIDRYKDHPSLDTYQLENEFFLKVFGICPDHSRERLVDEYKFVKEKDPNTPVIVTRSNNAWGWPINEPIPDISGVSVYKRVWDKTLTKRYFEYPFPAWFYGFLAGGTKIVTGRDLIIHELQTESWGPDKGIKEMTIDEQNQSLNAERLRDRIRYGKATGMREIDLWGVESWYWRKTRMNDPSLWDAGKAAIREQQCYDCYLPRDSVLE
ncbi:hypothetical protein EKI60_02415 [Candidatus Saccharibacteria bacterium]|nr:MAG: hypothetical protein EKI60_02415 [Candidatus Saccharibacteria bacterium]